MNKRLLKFFQIAFLVLIGLLIGRVIYENWQEITKYQWTLNLPSLTSAFLLLLGYSFLLSLSWQKLVLLTGEKLPLKAGYKITVLSALARYLPGGIWDHVGRFALAKKEYGLEEKRVFLSVLLNIVLTVFAGVAVFLLSLLSFSSYPNLRFLSWSLIFIPLGLVTLYPPLLKKIMNFILSKLGKEQLKLSFSYPQILKTTFWFFLSWVIIGFSFFLLICSFSVINLSLLPTIVGIFAISWVIGFLTPIAPNGAGVREASLILLLGTVIPAPLAIVSALSFRLLIIAGDITSAAIGAKL